MKICLYTAVQLVLLANVEASGSGSYDNATSLLRTMFTDYENSVVPTCADLPTVQVQIGLAVRQIIELDEPKQILQTNVWFRLRWVDCTLKWNATENGVQSLRVPYGTAWMPDITLYDKSNPMDYSAENEIGGKEDYLLEVRSDGSVRYNYPSVIRSLCKVDVTYFPFDTQVCKLTFGSWSFNGWELNVSALAPEGDLSSYVSNVEWEVTGVPVVRHELIYGCCPEPFPDVTFYIQLQRKPQFYVLSLLFPCILMSSMALLGFILPPESGEKITLDITVLLSVAVFMLMVSETMPPNSETFPYIGIYFACAMLLVSMSCLMTVVVLNVHFKGEYGTRFPTWMRFVFFRGIGRVLGASPIDNKVNDLNNETRRSENTNTSAPNDTEASKKELQIQDYEPTNKFADLLDRQLETLENISEGVSNPRKDVLVEEWKALARVIDRMCLVLFTLLQFCGILILLCGTAFRAT